MPAYLDHLLAERAASDPDAPFIEFEDRRWTYSRAEALVDRGARLLIEAGIAPGDRVLVLGDNSDAFAIAVLSALRAGAIFIPVSPAIAAAMLPCIIESADPRAVLADAPMLSAHVHSLSGTPLLELGLMVAQGRPTRGGSPPPPGTRGDDACIIYTSGSTSLSRGVLCTHSAILAVSSMINESLGQVAGDRILCALPFSFDYGLYQLFLALDRGASVVIAPLSLPPLALPALLERRSVTVLPIVPGLCTVLLRSRLLERARLASLRLVTNTGDILARAQRRRLQQVLGAAEIVPMYGLTECKRATIMPLGRSEEAPRSVGLPLFGSQIELRPLEGATGPGGDWGELLIRGPHLMAGYWRDPAASAIRFGVDPRSGVRTLRTGDVFSRDGAGFLTYLGRAELLGMARGQWLFTGPVEDRLTDLDSIDQAAAIVVRRGQEATVIRLFLSGMAPAAGVEEEARAIVAESCPDSPEVTVSFARKLPYTVNGKIDRAALAERTAN